MDIDKLKINDGIKIYVSTASDGAFVGYCYAEDLPEHLHAALGLTDTKNELEVMGEYDVKVENVDDEQAEIILGVFYILNDAKQITVGAESPGIDRADIEKQIEKKINWGHFWADRRAALSDYYYDIYKDL